MRRMWMLGLLAVVCGLVSQANLLADIIHFSSASVSGGTSDFDTSDSPNSVTGEGILNNGFAFAKSDEYAVNGWVNDGLAVKSADSYYEEELTTSEFQARYGVFPGGGPLEVTVAYRLSLVGNSVNGGGVRLRLEKLAGGIVEDSFTTISPVSQSGTLTAVQSSCCTPSGIRIRLTGNVDTGGNSFGTYAASITEIKYNGQIIFSGPQPVPEPTAACLALVGLFAAPSCADAALTRLPAAEF